MPKRCIPGENRCFIRCCTQGIWYESNDKRKKKTKCNLHRQKLEYVKKQHKHLKTKEKLNRSTSWINTRLGWIGEVLVQAYYCSRKIKCIKSAVSLKKHQFKEHKQTYSIQTDTLLPFWSLPSHPCYMKVHLEIKDFCRHHNNPPSLAGSLYSPAKRQWFSYPSCPNIYLFPQFY